MNIPHHHSIRLIAGLRFGRLTTIREIEKSKRGSRQWLCACDCGGNTSTTVSALRYGNTKSCGCLRVECHKLIAEKRWRKVRGETPLRSENSRSRVTFARTTAKSIKQRDNFACVRCGRKAGLIVHHIKLWCTHPKLRFDKTNLVTLCHDCHLCAHSRKYDFIDPVLAATFTEYIAGVQ